MLREPLLLAQDSAAAKRRQFPRRAPAEDEAAGSFGSWDLRLRRNSGLEGFRVKGFRV